MDSTNELKQSAERLAAEAKQTLADAAEVVEEKAKAAAATASTLAADAKESLGGKADVVMEKGKVAAATAGEVVKDAADVVEETAKRAWDAVTNFFEDDKKTN